MNQPVRTPVREDGNYTGDHHLILSTVVAVVCFVCGCFLPVACGLGAIVSAILVSFHDVLIILFTCYHFLGYSSRQSWRGW